MGGAHEGGRDGRVATAYFTKTSANDEFVRIASHFIVARSYLRRAGSGKVLQPALQL
jgi:hypothetical protein